MSNANANKSENHHRISEDDLLRYIENTMTEAEKHAIELELQENAFLSDAVDGLQETTAAHRKTNIEELNRYLSKQLQHKRKRSGKKIKHLGLIVLAVVILLVLVLGSYAVLHHLKF